MLLLLFKKLTYLKQSPFFQQLQKDLFFEYKYAFAISPYN
jgi:hypothetical protein